MSKAVPTKTDTPAAVVVMSSEQPTPTEKNRLPFRGALLNTLTVLVGSLIGLAIGTKLAPELQSIALSGIGLVAVGIAM